MNINITLIAQMIAFALLVWIVNKFLWGPITGMLATRQKSIADGLAAGDQGRRDLEQAKKESEDLLQKTRQQTQDLLVAAQKRAAAIEDEARQKAKIDAEQIKVAAKADVEQEIVRAREHLRQQVASITVAGAEKILEKEVDKKTHAKLLDELAGQL